MFGYAKTGLLLYNLEENSKCGASNNSELVWWNLWERLIQEQWVRSMNWWQQEESCFSVTGSFRSDTRSLSLALAWKLPQSLLEYCAWEMPSQLCSDIALECSNLGNFRRGIRCPHLHRPRMKLRRLSASRQNVILLTYWTTGKSRKHVQKAAEMILLFLHQRDRSPLPPFPKPEQAQYTGRRNIGRGIHHRLVLVLPWELWQEVQHSSGERARTYLTKNLSPERATQTPMPSMTLMESDVVRNRHIDNTGSAQSSQYIKEGFELEMLEPLETVAEGNMEADELAER